MLCGVKDISGSPILVYTVFSLEGYCYVVVHICCCFLEKAQKTRRGRWLRKRMEAKKWGERASEGFAYVEKNDNVCSGRSI